MLIMKVGKEDYSVYTKEEADFLKINYCYWRDIWHISHDISQGATDELTTHVIGDDDYVQPILRLYSTLLVVPSGTYHYLYNRNIKPRMYARVDRSNRRFGKRGSDPPGDGPLTAKHMQFCWEYIMNDFNGQKAFLSVWHYGRNNMIRNGNRYLRDLLMDEKIQSHITKLTSDLLIEGGVTEGWLIKRLKDFCTKDDKLGFEAVKLAMQAHGMLPNGNIPKFNPQTQLPPLLPPPASVGGAVELITGSTQFEDPEYGDNLDSMELPDAYISLASGSAGDPDEDE